MMLVALCLEVPGLDRAQAEAEMTSALEEYAQARTGAAADSGDGALILHVMIYMCKDGYTYI